MAQQSNKVVSNQVLGVSLLVSTEIMFFTGLISAFLVTKSRQLNWPPGFQQRFPVGYSVLNMLVLLVSGITMIMAINKYKHQTAEGKTAVDKNTLSKLLMFTFAGGLFFVLFQGVEWIRLIEFGLRSTTNIYGSFFYLIVGAHGLHVLGGLLALLFFVFAGNRKPEVVKAVGVYWVFVVALWPVLYYLVYMA